MTNYIEDFNWKLEILARLIEAKTGDSEAAEIVRDAKLPIRDKKEKPVTPKNDKKKVTG